MNGTEISLVIKQKSSNFTELAEAIGTKPSHIHNVVHRKVTSRPIAKKIALALETPFEQLFPDYLQKEAKQVEKRKRIAHLAKLANS